MNASDGSSLSGQGYCFAKGVNLDKVKNHTRQLLLKGQTIDVVSTPEKSCIEMKKVAATPEVMKRFIQKKFIVESAYLLNQTKEDVKANVVPFPKTCRMVFFKPGTNNMRRWMYLIENKYERVEFKDSWINVTCSNNNGKYLVRFKNKDDPKTVSFTLEAGKELFLTEILKKFTGVKISGIEEYSFTVHQ